MAMSDSCSICDIAWADGAGCPLCKSCAEVARLREALSKIADVVSDGARAGMSIMRGIAEDALKGGSDG